MTDLRDRLVRRGDRFELDPGALDRTLERGMRTQRRRRVAVGVLALAIGAVGTVIAFSTLPRGTVRPPADRPSPSAATLPTIPDGIYATRRLTRQQLLETMTNAGFTRREATEYFFDPAGRFDQWVRMGLVIKDGAWIQTQETDTGNQEAGWGGTFRVTGPDTLQAYGYGCTITYRFSVSGRTLILNVIGETGQAAECGPGDMVAQTAIFDSAPFVRER